MLWNQAYYIILTCSQMFQNELWTCISRIGKKQLFRKKWFVLSGLQICNLSRAKKAISHSVCRFISLSSTVWSLSLMLELYAPYSDKPTMSTADPLTCTTSQLVRLSEAEISSPLGFTDTHTHTHTHRFSYLLGTLHSQNGFYTVQTVFSVHLP